MKIVLTPQGSHGDVRPLAALGSALRSAGHDVLFGASSNHQAWLEGLGFRFHPVGLDMEAPSETADDSVGNPLRTAINGVKLILNMVPAQFGALQELVDDADLVIGSGLEFAGRSLAEQRGIAYRFVCHVPTALPSAHHPPVAIPYRPLPRWINRWLWMVNMMGTKLTVGRAIQKQRARLGMSPIRSFAQHFSSNAVLSADAALAPAPPDMKAAFRTSYFALEGDCSLPAEIEAFINAGAPPVYIGFGSMPDPTPLRSLRVFEELSRTHRLIVFNQRARSACQRELPNVHWVDKVSHAALFPRVAAVVHHGGAGTTHTAARAGIPQIIVPHLLDQYYWAFRAKQLGVAPESLSLRKLSAVTLGSALGKVLNGPAAHAASALGEELRTSADQSMQTTVRYLETLSRQHG